MIGVKTSMDCETSQGSIKNIVGERGLEPPSLAAPRPKRGVDTNFTTRPHYFL